MLRATVGSCAIKLNQTMSAEYLIVPTQIQLSLGGEEKSQHRKLNLVGIILRLICFDSQNQVRPLIVTSHGNFSWTRL